MDLFCPSQQVCRVNRIWFFAVLMSMELVQDALGGIDMNLESPGYGTVGDCGLFRVYLSCQIGPLSWIHGWNGKVVVHKKY